MRTLNNHLDTYLKLRRQLGFKLVEAEKNLRKFVNHAKSKRASFVTTKLALQWATRPPTVKPTQWATRYGMVRQFAEYLSAVDPRTEIPPQKLLPFPLRRRDPHIYRDEEVLKLIEAAGQIRSPKGLKGITYFTLFGLLAVTGMRIGEVLNLDREDVDLEQGLLTIRRGKGNKSRLVPVHASTQTALRYYATLRDRLCRRPTTPSFFVSEDGGRLLHCTVHHWFILLSRRIGLRGPGARQGPRLHDLRHRFAIQTLVRWYRSKKDVEQHLPELATYLGHVHVRFTYWYLSATPELLQMATRRLPHIKGEWYS